jgi:GT2 family glycosyltransferase
MIDLSIVIVSFNTRDRLERCLLSLEDQPGEKELRVEVFVVDNASCDGSADMVDRRFPAVRLIRNDRNRGYAAANNQALRVASGKALLLLNPDTVVPHGVLSVLVRHMHGSPDVGIVGCRLVRLDGSLDKACRRSFPTPFTALCRFLRLCRIFPSSRLVGRYNLTYLDPRGSYEVDSVVGAFMLVRREVYSEIGGLDESFFMYGEDLDWCFRARERGFAVRYVGSASVVHEKGASSRKAALRMHYHFHRAMVLFHRKHLRGRYPAAVNAIVYAGIAARLVLLAPPLTLLAAWRRLFARENGRRRAAACREEEDGAGISSPVASPASTTP